MKILITLYLISVTILEFFLCYKLISLGGFAWIFAFLLLIFTIAYYKEKKESYNEAIMTGHASPNILSFWIYFLSTTIYAETALAFILEIGVFFSLLCVYDLKWYICALAAFPNLNIITLPIIAFIYLF